MTTNCRHKKNLTPFPNRLHFFFKLQVFFLSDIYFLISIFSKNSMLITNVYEEKTNTSKPFAC